MSQKSNKRAKRLTDENLLGSNHPLLGHDDIAKLENSDLFFIAPGAQGSSARAKARKAALINILFNRPEPQDMSHKLKPTPKPFKPTPSKPSGASAGMVQRKLASRMKRITTKEARNRQVVAKLTAKHQQKQEKQAAEEATDEQDDDGFDHQLWKEMTGGLTTPLPAYRAQHLAAMERFRQKKQQDAALFDKASRVSTRHIKATPNALARAVVTNIHMDSQPFTMTQRQGDARKIDLEDNEVYDVWDADVSQLNAEGALPLLTKSQTTTSLDDDLSSSDDDDDDEQDAADDDDGKLTIQQLRQWHRDHNTQQFEQDAAYLDPLLVAARKTHRSAKSHKHVTGHTTQVAPPGLSINPRSEDLEAIEQVYSRRVKNIKRQAARLNTAITANYKIRMPKNPSAADKAHFAKLYEPVESKPTEIKIKTRSERNREKKTAENRYKHVRAMQVGRFNRSLDKVTRIIRELKKRERFVNEKRPKIRAELRELRESQPVRLGRNFYTAPLPDMQTKNRLSASRGQLRRVHASSNLLRDLFAGFQRTNMIPAVGKSGKNRTRRVIPTTVVKAARAASARLENIDVAAVLARAQERAERNPKSIGATKNKKRKAPVPLQGTTKQSYNAKQDYDDDDDENNNNNNNDSSFIDDGFNTEDLWG